MAYNPMEVFYTRRCAKYLYTIPSGLRELMSDISREVIRENTGQEHMYTFIADYLDSLFITRENCRVATRVVNEIIITSKVVTNLMREVDCSKRRADYAARVIQTAFRSYICKRKRLNYMPDDTEKMIVKILPERLDLTSEKANIAATIIQKAFRSFRRQSMLNDNMSLNWRYRAQRTIGSYRQTNPTEAEMHRAATLIKAAYKGYYTRRRLEGLREKARKEYLKNIVEYPVEEEIEEEYDYVIRALKSEMLQRIRDEYSALTNEQLTRTDASLKQIVSKSALKKIYPAENNSRVNFTEDDSSESDSDTVSSEENSLKLQDEIETEI